AQLLDHGLHPRALDADARTHRIDVGVPRGDGDLAPRTGLAGDAHDLDDPLVNLGDFGLEQLVDQLRCAAAQDDHRTARFAIDVLDEGHDAIAGPVGFARSLLARGQDAFGASEVDDDVVTLLEAPDDPADQLTLAILVLVVDDVALRIAHPLEQNLLRGLRGDAP